MKKLLLIPLVIVLMGSLIFGGCAEPEPEPTPTPTPTPTPEPEPEPAPEPEPEPGGPVYGGDLKIITASSPNVLGGSLEQGPFDLFVLLGGVEKLVEYDENHGGSLSPPMPPPHIFIIRPYCWFFIIGRTAWTQFTVPNRFIERHVCLYFLAAIVYPNREKNI